MPQGRPLRHLSHSCCQRQLLSLPVWLEFLLEFWFLVFLLSMRFSSFMIAHGGVDLLWPGGSKICVKITKKRDK